MVSTLPLLDLLLILILVCLWSMFLEHAQVYMRRNNKCSSFWLLFYKRHTAYY
ncbi:hypothetical protein WN51_00014 [Melipona quadrifasciata]|uniref:Uncharacterized protein n=1 Tax=Melipona quadrifasciata TaxID=166423 RepID=A0A0M8ZPE1_9HYME|nr:hypothetical protein WN51_00014 [Melipona quadrifasciata]